MKVNLYLLVFGIVVAIIAVAAVSTYFFNKQQPATVTLSSLPDYGPAPPLIGISGWINSGPLNISQFQGNVVLIDFWTYSCINCIREIPHVEAWYNAYGHNGLVVIGVSAPEFQFETNYTNVQDAVERFNITYPVALDNDHLTWDAYDNHYWPAEYLINASGDVRYINFGEGNYNETEEVIRLLLIQSGHTIQPNFTNVPLGVNFSGIGTPEQYLGWALAPGHSETLGNPQGFAPNATVDYTLPSALLNNTVYLEGNWYNAPDGMIAVNGSEIFLIYKAKSVNVVAQGNSTLTVKLDGSNLPSDCLGSSDTLVNGTATAVVGAAKLYNVVDCPSYGWHEIEIDASPGFKIYTFTFG